MFHSLLYSAYPVQRPVCPTYLFISPFLFCSFYTLTFVIRKQDDVFLQYTGGLGLLVYTHQLGGFLIALVDIIHGCIEGNLVFFPIL